MWKFLLLLVATAATAWEWDCGSSIYQQCGRDRTLDLVDEIPLPEEIDEHCRHGLKYYECASKVVKKCNQSDPYVMYNRDLESNVKRICDKDDPLHDALMASLPCIKKNRDEISLCPPLHGEDIETFTKELAGIGISDIGDSEINTINCLHYMHTMGCTAANVGKVCDDVAKNAVIELFEGFQTHFRHCLSGIKENSRKVTDMMQGKRNK